MHSCVLPSRMPGPQLGVCPGPRVHPAAISKSCAHIAGVPSTDCLPEQGLGAGGKAEGTLGGQMQPHFHPQLVQAAESV